MNAFRAILIVTATALLLGACETPVPSRKFPEISFRHEAPYRLDVANIEVEKRIAAPQKGEIVHELPVSLATVAENWVRQRLTAVGNSGTAVVYIEKASVVEEKLAKTGGIRGAFTTDQTERYTGELQMTMELSNGGQQGTVKAGARKAQTIAEDATLAEREKLWFDMVEKLARDVDAQMNKQINTHLTNFLR
jgi:hypothetical protein